MGKNLIASIRGASGAQHTVVTLVTLATVLYNTKPSYKADVIALWNALPHPLQLIAVVVIPPIAIYWNTVRNQLQQPAPTAGSGEGKQQNAP